MEYSLFLKLHNEAMTYGEVEMFIAERGWEDWMEEYPEERLGGLLKSIYGLANSDLKTNRELVGLNREQFCSMYDIPVSTVGKWDRGEREMPKYVKRLIDYVLFVDWLDG